MKSLLILVFEVGVILHWHEATAYRFILPAKTGAPYSRQSGCVLIRDMADDEDVARPEQPDCAVTYSNRQFKKLARIEGDIQFLPSFVPCGTLYGQAPPDVNHAVEFLKNCSRAAYVDCLECLW